MFLGRGALSRAGFQQVTTVMITQGGMRWRLWLIRVRYYGTGSSETWVDDAEAPMEWAGIRMNLRGQWVCCSTLCTEMDNSEPSVRRSPWLQYAAQQELDSQISDCDHHPPEHHPCAHGYPRVRCSLFSWVISYLRHHKITFAQ